MGERVNWTSQVLLNKTYSCTNILNDQRKKTTMLMMLIMLYQKLGMKPSAIFLKRALKYSHTKLSKNLSSDGNENSDLVVFKRMRRSHSKPTPIELHLE